MVKNSPDINKEMLLFDIFYNENYTIILIEK